jgi:hypothetical protein
MRFYIFKSEPNSTLRAFSADKGGEGLPKQFAPWHAVGVVRPDKDPPHNLRRDMIEKALNTTGFQLWRMKSDKKKAAR